MSKALEEEFKQILSINLEEAHHDNFSLFKNHMVWIEFYINEEYGDRYKGKIQECFSFVPLNHEDILHCRHESQRDKISDEKCFTNDNKSFVKCVGELQAEIASTDSNEL